MNNEMLTPFQRVQQYVARFGIYRGLPILRAVRQSKHRRVAIKLPGYEQPIFLSPNSSDRWIFDEVFVDQCYKFDLQDRQPQLIIDAGANSGYTAIYFAHRYPSAQILAVEIEPRNYERMCQNTASYPAIQPLNGALWYKSDCVAIHDPSGGRSTMSFQATDSARSETRTVRAYTIDDLLALAGRDYVDILKIDIEGGEKELFTADSDSWLERVGVLMIELHDRIRPGCSNAFYHSVSKYSFRQELNGLNVCLIFEQPGLN
jgi:FkbM family methyltransferase